MSTELHDEKCWEAKGLGIAGRQLINGYKAIKGDLVINYRNERYIESANKWEYDDECVKRIYRKIPTPKQGGCCDRGKEFSAVAEVLESDQFEKPKFPTDAKARKNLPVFTGVLDYFPDAVLAVAHCSKVGNSQHNPGQSLHWDRTKSMDHADSMVRHAMERGKRDTDGVRHSAKAAWRALAALQLEIENDTDKSP